MAATTKTLVTADNTQVTSNPARVFRVLVTCQGGAIGDLVTLRNGTGIGSTALLAFIIDSANYSQLFTLGIPEISTESGQPFDTALRVSTTGAGSWRVWIEYI